MLNDDIAKAVRRKNRRKVEHIVARTYQAFHDEISMYGTLDAEEIMAIGLNLIEAIMIKPLQRMSNDPHKMRETVVYQIAALVGDTPEEMGN